MVRGSTRAILIPAVHRLDTEGPGKEASTARPGVYWANSLPAAHTVSASRRQGRERTRREESVLPNYNDANDINDLNIAYIAKRRRVRELECRHVKPPGEWHREGGGRRVDGTK